MITIRKADKKDLAAIHLLVTELAVYEEEPDAVTATLKDYETDFEAGLFKAYVAEIDGKIVGMALYYWAYSTWKGRMLFLEDFVVTMKWQVLDWNEPAINFYKKYNAIIEDDWLNVNFSKEQLYK